MCGVCVVCGVWHGSGGSGVWCLCGEWHQVMVVVCMVVVVCVVSVW